VWPRVFRNFAGWVCAGDLVLSSFICDFGLHFLDRGGFWGAGEKRKRKDAPFHHRLVFPPALLKMNRLTFELCCSTRKQLTKSNF
jgi:hypothetical protein